MLDRLPQFIDPILFADKQRELIGIIPLLKFTRLADALLDNSGQVTIEFTFSKEDRRPVIRGHIKAELTLSCCCCLNAVLFPVDIEINLAVVHSIEQAERLAGQHEPLLLTEEKIALHELVEDELLLVLPDFPRHQEECATHYLAESFPVLHPLKNTQLTSNNPFSVLAKLKNIGD